MATNAIKQCDKETAIHVEPFSVKDLSRVTDAGPRDKGRGRWSCVANGGAAARVSRLGPMRLHPSAVGLEFSGDKYEAQPLTPPICSIESRVRREEQEGEMFIEKFKVESPNVRYGEDEIDSVYHYETTELVHECRDGVYQWIVKPKTVRYNFKTRTRVPRLGYPLRLRPDYLFQCPFFFPFLMASLDLGLV